jgi:energy-coupling factor transporter ATP-binding protein EcfA2
MIILKDVTYFYPESTQPALKDINLEIKQGEFILIVGLTGSGKSTLLYLLNGIIPHIFGGRLSGKVVVDSFSPKDKPIREISKIVGTVFQNPDTQIFMLKVEDDVCFGCENLLLPKEEIIRRKNSSLKELGLWEIKDKSVFKLSGGQKQRLAIASVYAMGPKIFLFDEPATDLDKKGRSKFLEILKKLKEKGKTIILVEHQYEEFLKLADKLVILEEGKMVRKTLPHNLNRVIMPKIFKSVSSQCLIELKNIYFEYEKGVLILKDINLRIKKGEVVAILGENGSGKTTLFKILLGLLKPASGKIIILNMVNPNLENLVGKVGFLFQNPDEQLFTNSVLEEITFGPKQLKKKVDIEKYLKLVNFVSFKNRHPQTLSRGQRQLLAILSILAMEPEILILDEPTTGLDHKSWMNLFEILYKFNEDDKTIIFSTHNEKTKSFAHHIIYLNEGKIIKDEVLR